MRRGLIYFGFIFITVILIYGVIQAGKEISVPVTLPSLENSALIGKEVGPLVHSPFALLLIQTILIIPLARGLGALFLKINQPMVIGEILAGILLGPSVLGWLAPSAYHAIFPPESFSGLQLLSQVGLIFFMFLVGLEFNPRLLKGKGEAAVATSHASILAPFLLGTILALYLYPKLSDNHVSFVAFALFMGAAMSVTAFPVLARILNEQKLTQTKMGALVLTCAAIDDVTAWLLLAFVISVVRATGLNELLLILLWTTLYIVAMIFLLRPLLKRFEKRYSTREGLSQNAVAIIFILLMASALTTEKIGIHALFGAFFLGAIMPNETGFVRHLSEKIEDIAVLFLLPLFFAYTGLRTQIGLLGTPELWLLAGLVLLVACLGKFGGSFVVSKIMGLSWRESATVGILMNTRGLMELVILSIGLDLGVISPVLFTMLVLMALVTTFITSPLLAWVYPRERFFEEGLETTLPGIEKPFTVLVSIALLKSGRGLLKVAESLAGRGKAGRIYALHLTPATERPSYFVKGPRAKEGFSELNPAMEETGRRGVDLRPLNFISNDPSEDIVEVGRVKSANLILLGWHKPVLGGALLGGTVRQVMREAASTVGVFIDRGLGDIRRILVPYLSSEHDREALALAHRFITNRDAQVVILHVVDEAREGPKGQGAQSEIDRQFIEPNTKSKVELKIVTSASPIDAILAESRSGYDLVMLGVSEELDLEGRIFGFRPERIAAECPTSMLIVHQVPSSRKPGKK